MKAMFTHYYFLQRILLAKLPNPSLYGSCSDVILEFSWLQTASCGQLCYFEACLRTAFDRTVMLCRKQHREELVRLQQQLKSSSASSKGGAVEAERTKKDLDKTRWAVLQGVYASR